MSRCSSDVVDRNPSPQKPHPPPAASVSEKPLPAFRHALPPPEAGGETCIATSGHVVTQGPPPSFPLPFREGFWWTNAGRGFPTGAKVLDWSLKYDPATKSFSDDPDALTKLSKFIFTEGVLTEKPAEEKEDPKKGRTLTLNTKGLGPV